MAGQAKGLRVLVVDDCTEAAEDLTSVLASWGHEARASLDGPSALATAAAFCPQAVLLELSVPRLDGQELARLLRSQAGERDLLLVALSDEGGERQRRLTDEAGFDCLLVTPAEPEALRRALAGVRPD
jgi:two-component system CheB/CheR fusion protein